METRPKLPNREFVRLQEAISVKRLTAFKKTSSCGNIESLANYLWNISLSEALYPVLHNFEISIRNNFYDAISRVYGKNWLTNKNLNILLGNEINNIDKAIKQINGRSQELSSDNLISELNLGFWVSLSYSRYEGKHKFFPILFKDREFLPYLSKSRRTRKILSENFTSIQKLRNKIFHHGPIWNHKDLQKEYEATLEAIQWISPILYKTTKNLSRFPHVYSQGYTNSVKIVEEIIKNSD